MKFAGIFALVVGFLMFGQWVVSLATGGAFEFVANPLLVIGSHLAAEVLTALALILSGLAILKKIAWGRTLFLVAGGMALYSIIINGPGYFVQRGEWPMAAVFGGLFVGAVVALMGAAFHQR